MVLHDKSRGNESCPASDDNRFSSAMRGVRSPRNFSVTERLAIVREAYERRGVAARVARKFEIALNTIYLWRRIYGERLVDQPCTEAVGNAKVATLLAQVRMLEKLIEQKASEADCLRTQLGRQAGNRRGVHAPRGNRALVERKDGKD